MEPQWKRNLELEQTMYHLIHYNPKHARRDQPATSAIHLDIDGHKEHEETQETDGRMEAAMTR
jgi:hypothetical protein